MIERALYNGINSGMSLDGKPTATAIRWPSILRHPATTRFAIRGTTPPAARPTSSAPSPRCPATSTARPAKECTFTCTTIPSCMWQLGSGSQARISGRPRSIRGRAQSSSPSRRRRSGVHLVRPHPGLVEAQYGARERHSSGAGDGRAVPADQAPLVNRRQWSS